MRCPDRSPDEPGRLRALAEYRIDEAEGLPSLDAIVDMAARLFGCPAAAVNMVGEERVFLASSVGVPGEFDHSREASFCAHAINQTDVMVVEDARSDPRFHDNPLVSAGMIRFYAGIALRAPSGHALGALCVIDTEAHDGFTPPDRDRLAALARLVSDKLELRRLEVAAQKGADPFRTMANTSPGAILSCDEAGLITAANPAACALFGHSEDSLRDRPVEQLFAAADGPAVHHGLDQARHGTLPITQGTVVTAIGPGGLPFQSELHFSHWHEETPEGERIHFGIVVDDLTFRLREDEALHRLTHYDPLTGLPNRALLMQQLEAAFAARQPVGLIVVDLSGFTDINNTMGHAAGDDVLRQAAARIRDVAGSDAHVARIGGDEFAAMLPLRDPLTLGAAARAINRALSRPMLAGDGEVRVGSDCGMAMAPDHADTPDELMGNAELALLQARKGGHNEAAMFAAHMRASAVARRMVEADLVTALEHGQLELFYQPQVSLHSAELTGAEALIRWRHPAHGLLDPAAFLPAVEAGPLALPVAQWVLDTACAQAAEWREADPEFRISVNLSASQFREGDLAAAVRNVLERHRLPAEALELEITENIILDGQDSVLDQLRPLRAMGVHLSFDDFGTGFASLTMLRDFPVGLLKIDRSFIQSMQSSPRDRTIVTGVIRLARELGLEVVAEGVETKSAAQFLRRHFCDKAQGFLFGAPCPAAAFAQQHLNIGPKRPRLVRG